LGEVTNFYGMPGMLENAMPFRTLADAIELRNRLIHVLEEADVEEDGELRQKLLTFVVGGGGFSGVEVLAELNNFVRSVKKNYNRLRDARPDAQRHYPGAHSHGSAADSEGRFQPAAEERTGVRRSFSRSGEEADGAGAWGKLGA
jgi:NADH dehydrogenase